MTMAKAARPAVATAVSCVAKMSDMTEAYAAQPACEGRPGKPLSPLSGAGEPVAFPREACFSLAPGLACCRRACCRVPARAADLRRTVGPAACMGRHPDVAAGRSWCYRRGDGLVPVPRFRP